MKVEFVFFIGRWADAQRCPLVVNLMRIWIGPVLFSLGKNILTALWCMYVYLALKPCFCVFILSVRMFLLIRPCKLVYDARSFTFTPLLTKSFPPKPGNQYWTGVKELPEKSSGNCFCMQALQGESPNIASIQATDLPVILPKALFFQY